MATHLLPDIIITKVYVVNKNSIHIINYQLSLKLVSSCGIQLTDSNGLDVIEVPHIQALLEWDIIA